MDIVIIKGNHYNPQNTTVVHCRKFFIFPRSFGRVENIKIRQSIKTFFRDLIVKSYHRVFYMNIYILQTRVCVYGTFPLFE